MALTLLNCSDEFSRRKATANNLAQQENYIPLSARFKHSLTSSKLLLNDEVFNELHNSCTEAVQTMQQTLRRNTISLQKRELYAAKLQLQLKYIHHSLTLTHMLLINAKLQPKNKFLNFTLTDGHLSKIALLKYIQLDSTAIMKYLDCSFNRITLLLDQHTNYKQDPYDLFPYTIPRHIDNDEDPIFPHTSNQQNETDSTYHHTYNTPTTTNETTHNSFDYELPETPTYNNDTQTPHTNNPQKNDLSTPQNNNQNNFHINLTTNHGDNITNNFATDSPNQTTQLQKTTLLPTFQSAASILQNNNSHNQTPTQHQTTTKTPNTPITTPNNNNIQHNQSTSPNNTDKTPTNHQPTNKPHSTVPNPYLKRPTNNNLPHTSPHVATPTIHTHTHPPFNNITPQPTTPLTTNNTETNSIGHLHNTTNPHQPTENVKNNQHVQHITTDDLSQHPHAEEITNNISSTLQQILPTLTYHLSHEVSSKRDEEAAANAALAWYQQQLTKSATEQVAQALNNEPKANPETLQTLINDSVNKAVEKRVASAQTKLTKTIHQNIQKNSQGLPHQTQTTGRPFHISESAYNQQQQHSTHPKFTPANPTRYLHNQSHSTTHDQHPNQSYNQSHNKYPKQPPYSPTTHTNYLTNRATKQHQLLFSTET